MKHWPSQTFPIIVLALLAGLTFWLQKTVEEAGTTNDGKFRHDPDAMAENFVIRRFDEVGRVKYRLSGPYMEHFPDDDSTELRSPTLIAYRADAPDLTVNSQHARGASQGETIFLWDDVVLTRDADAGRPPLVARMPFLTAQPELGFAFTDSPVEITQGPSWIKGTGMEIDNNKSTLVLRSQVRGSYIRSRVQP